MIVLEEDAEESMVLKSEVRAIICEINTSDWA